MGARLDRAWRTVATGLCFVLFGVGGLLLTLLAMPLLALCVRSRPARKRYAQRLISRSFAAFIGFMRLAGVLEYRVQGLEHLQQPGCLVVANHPSLIDVVFLVAFMREVDCVVKARLWHNPVTGLPVRMAGYISNAAAPELILKCQQALERGNRLIVFPEGTRSEPGRPLRFQRGAAHIALNAGADIVPVTIVLRESTLTKGERWYHVPVRRIGVSISVDRPITITSYRCAYGSPSIAARRLTGDLHRYYSTRLAEAAVDVFDDDNEKACGKDRA